MAGAILKDFSYEDEAVKPQGFECQKVNIPNLKPLDEQNDLQQLDGEFDNQLLGEN